MSNLGKGERPRRAAVFRADSVILAVILIASAVSFAWRDAGVSCFARAETAAGTVISYEMQAFHTAHAGLGRLLAVLGRNVKITQSRRDCIQTGCPVHLTDGRTANEGTI